jgi:hypothetical protein
MSISNTAGMNKRATTGTIKILGNDFIMIYEKKFRKFDGFFLKFRSIKVMPKSLFGQTQEKRYLLYIDIRITVTNMHFYSLYLKTINTTKIPIL